VVLCGFYLFKSILLKKTPKNIKNPPTITKTYPKPLRDLGITVLFFLKKVKGASRRGQEYTIFNLVFK